MAMEYWDKAPRRRDQIVLFAPTLEDSISEDHPVRLLEEILRQRDWSDWEVEYDGTRGRPPIPPWVMAGVILYGLMRRVRSSHILEYLCTHSIDYVWLVEGRTLDYSTICKFRSRFRKPLKDLFRQVVKVGMRMGLVTLLKVAFDGTRVKANASRSQTWTAEKLEVVADTREDRQTLPAVDRIEENFGAKPEAEWANLPRNGRKKLAASCFVYDAEADCYYCPLGRVLHCERTKHEPGWEAQRLYRAQDCSGCPLAAVCRDPHAKRGRTILRDAHEPSRERMYQRMHSPEGQATYALRMHAAETPFAFIKFAMGVRQFLLRGLAKVRTEWLWICTAYNLRKLLTAVGRLRAKFAKMVVETTS